MSPALAQAPSVHVALLPSSGMGHLTPCLRLAAMFIHHDCHVTLITPEPTVSDAESKLLSKFLSSFPQVNHIKFHLPSSVLTNSVSHHHDPFFLRYKAIRSSSHLLLPILDSLSPPLSSFVYDVSLLSALLPVADALGVPHYLLFPCSATFVSFFSYFPVINTSLHGSDDDNDDVNVEIPGVLTMPKSSIPPQLLDKNNILFKNFMDDSPKLSKLDGVLVNTFQGLEDEAMEALNSGKVMKELPQFYGIGPIMPCEFEKEGERGSTLKWLDNQPSGSVVYVSFGSRTAWGRDQIREMGDGLVRSGFRFLWVVKDKTVDKEDEEGLEGVLGKDLMERTKEKGLVVKEWVDQREILNHNAVGGFLSHCGWNSVVEAAWFGVPILGWPHHGDQNINARVVVNGGWGVWKSDWGWPGERLVKGDEIIEAINELMNDESILIKARQVKIAARKAASVGGGSELSLKKLAEKWKNNNGDDNILESII